MKNLSGLIKHILATSFLGVALFFSQCSDSNDQKKPPLKNDFASRTIFNFEMTEKDSGEITYFLKSKLMEEYEWIDSPYVEFKKGLEVFYYPKNTDSLGYLRADYAKKEDAKDYLFATGNVVIITDKSDTLKTNSIYWDRKTKKINTKDTVIIISKKNDSLIAKAGMDATDDFKRVYLYNNSGEFSSKEKKP